MRDFLTFAVWQQKYHASHAGSRERCSTAPVHTRRGQDRPGDAGRRRRAAPEPPFSNTGEAAGVLGGSARSAGGASSRSGFCLASGTAVGWVPPEEPPPEPRGGKAQGARAAGPRFPPQAAPAVTDAARSLCGARCPHGPARGATPTGRHGPSHPSGVSRCPPSPAVAQPAPPPRGALLRHDTAGKGAGRRVPPRSSRGRAVIRSRARPRNPAGLGAGQAGSRKLPAAGGRERR